MSNDDISSLRDSLNQQSGGFGAGGLNELAESIKELNENIQKLIALFEEAQDEVVHNYEESHANVEQKLDEISNQNQKIAEGILAIADSTKDEGLDQEPQEVPEWNAPAPQEPSQPPQAAPQPTAPPAQQVPPQSPPSQYNQVPDNAPPWDQGWDQQEPGAQPWNDQSWSPDQDFPAPAEPAPPSNPAAPAAHPSQPAPPSQPQPPQQLQQDQSWDQQNPLNQPFPAPQDLDAQQQDSAINPNYPHYDFSQMKQPQPPQQQDLPQIPLPPERKGFLKKFKK